MDPQLFVEDRSLPLYRRGERDTEVRIAYRNVRDVSEVGFVVRFQSSTSEVRLRVMGVTEYRSYEDVLKNEDLNRVAPGMSPSQALAEWRRSHRIQDEQENGIVVLKVQVVE